MNGDEEDCEMKRAPDNVSSCPGGWIKDRDLFYFRGKSITGREIQQIDAGDPLLAKVTEKGRTGRMEERRKEKQVQL